MPKLLTNLISTNDYVVLMQKPLVVFWPFLDCHEAYAFATRHGGIVTTWHETEWIRNHYPGTDFAAFWFNGEWNDPLVIGPFCTIDWAEKFAAEIGFGSAVEIDDPENLEADEAA